MKIEIRKYESKYFFTFVFNLLNYRILKSAGIFKWRFIGIFIGSIFSKLFKKSNKKFLKFMIIVDGKVAGGIDLSQISGSNYSVGCIIFKEYWNTGVATKAIKKMSAIAKKNGVKKISIINDKNNIASIKLAKKFGLKKVKENEKEFFWERKV